jgi:hypothetical protein
MGLQGVTRRKRKGHSKFHIKNVTVDHHEGPGKKGAYRVLHQRPQTVPHAANSSPPRQLLATPLLSPMIHARSGGSRKQNAEHSSDPAHTKHRPGAKPCSGDTSSSVPALSASQAGQRPVSAHPETALGSPHRKQPHRKPRASKKTTKSRGAGYYTAAGRTREMHGFGGVGPLSWGPCNRLRRVTRAKAAQDL